MPPTILPEEPGSDSLYKPTTSRKWLVQVAFLFSLLLLGRGNRHASAPLPAARSPVPGPPAAPPSRQLLPMPYPAVASAAFSGLTQ